MSFDQSLISHSKDGVYAVPWMAGISGSQTLAKNYKSYDIESVNVPKICDALNRSLVAGVLDNENCVSEETVMPFRICTKLWYGTLKIYQQQVNNLYKASEDLVVRSNIYDIQTKNKKSSSQKATRKRRLTLTQSNDEISGYNTNYSHILEEMEKLAEQNNNEDEIITQNDLQGAIGRSVKQIQIREITIREINTAHNISELDDDSGFGEATNEDIIQFFSFSNCLEKIQNPSIKRVPAKRKCDYEEGPSEKRGRYYQEDENSFIKGTPTKRKGNFEEEPPSKQTRAGHEGENNFINTDLLETPRRSNIPKNTSPTVASPFILNDKIKEECSTVSEDLLETPRRCYDSRNARINTFQSPVNVSPFIFHDKIKEEYKSDEEMPDKYMANIINEVPLEKKIKEELVDIETTNKVKTSNVIIDHCIKIKKEEMLDVIGKQHKDLKGLTRTSFKKSKCRKRTPALELLRRCNKRNRLFCPDLKKKNIVDATKSKQDYINLLRDIFGSDYNEDLISLINPKCQKSSLKQQRPKGCDRPTNNEETIEIINCNMHNENANVIHNDMEDINLNNFQTLENNINENPAISNEWQPHGIMLKLLKIWQNSTDTKIDAVKFCHSSGVLINKAITFSSLLSLYKSHFLLITKHFGTIEMNKIVIGMAAKSLLKTN